MTRAALLALFLAGCSTNLLPPPPPPAVELVGFEWCTPVELILCAWVRQGSDLYVMTHPSRIGVEGAGWHFRVMDAIGE